MIIILVLLYIYGYYKYPKNIAMLQTDISRVKADILLERQPVVFEDAPSLDTIQKRLFRYSIVTKFSLKADVPLWSETKFKYTAIQVHEATEVMICPPGRKLVNNAPAEDEKLIAVQCKKGNILLIPFKWKYNAGISADCLGVHDIVTYLLP